MIRYSLYQFAHLETLKYKILHGGITTVSGNSPYYHSIQLWVFSCLKEDSLKRKGNHAISTVHPKMIGSDLSKSHQFWLIQTFRQLFRDNYGRTINCIRNIIAIKHDFVIADFNLMGHYCVEKRRGEVLRGFSQQAKSLAFSRFPSHETLRRISITCFNFFASQVKKRKKIPMCETKYSHRERMLCILSCFGYRHMSKAVCVEMNVRRLSNVCRTCV